MGLGYLILILFAAYGALKFYQTEKTAQRIVRNARQNPPGVSYYCNLAISQRPAQVLAAQQTNDCATSTGFAAAFGPEENMPNPRNEFFY